MKRLIFFLFAIFLAGMGELSAGLIDETIPPLLNNMGLNLKFLATQSTSPQHSNEFETCRLYGSITAIFETPHLECRSFSVMASFGEELTGDIPGCMGKGLKYGLSNLGSFDKTSNQVRQTAIANLSYAPKDPLAGVYSLKANVSLAGNPLCQVSAAPLEQAGVSYRLQGENFDRGTDLFSPAVNNAAQLNAFVFTLTDQFVMSKESGDNQKGDVGSILPDPLAVKILHFVNGGISPGQVPIEFSLAQAPQNQKGAFVSPGFITSNSSGIAQTTLTLGNKPGGYSVKAICSTCAPVEVFFDATATTKKVKLIKFTSDIAAIRGQKLSNGIKARAINSKDRGISDINVEFELLQNPGGVSFVNLSSATTDKNGIARVGLQLGPSFLGNYVIRAFCSDCQANQEVIYTITAIEEPQRVHQNSQITAFERKTISDSEGRNREDLGFDGLHVEVNPSTVAPQGTGGLPIQAQVFVFAPQNSTFTATVLSIFNTGGHQHNTARPAGTLSPTSGSGNATLLYTPSEVAGQEMIVVRDAQGRETTAFVNVWVEGLKRMDKNGSNHIAITGDPLHSEFTYGQQTLIDAIASIASEYKVITSSLIISINDMSLSNGGLFDVGGTWATPHVSHRTGVDVDVNRKSKVLGTPKSVLDTKLIFRICSIIRGPPKLDCCRIKEDGQIHFRCPCGGASDECSKNLLETP